MIATLTLGLSHRPAAASNWHLCTVFIPDGRSPDDLCAGVFGGVMTVGSGDTKNSTGISPE